MIPLYATLGKVSACATCHGTGTSWRNSDCEACHGIGLLFEHKSFLRNGVVHIPTFNGHELEVPCCGEKRERRFDTFRERLTAVTKAEERFKKAREELQDAERWLHEIRRGPKPE